MRAVAFLISGAASYTTGLEITVDGGWRGGQALLAQHLDADDETTG